MNTPFDNNSQIVNAFNDLFGKLTETDRIDNDAKLLMFRFLEIIDNKREALGWSRKELAKRVGTSASYITQLYNGDKLVNMTILAKFKNVLGIEFEIAEKSTYAQSVSNFQPLNDEFGFWVYHKFDCPNYAQKPQINSLPESPMLEVA
jgi:transcriptional regulator with XRE-family HTH domain